MILCHFDNYNHKGHEEPDVIWGWGIENMMSSPDLKWSLFLVKIMPYKDPCRPDAYRGGRGRFVLCPI